MTAWPYIPAYHHSSGSNFPIRRGVVHCTVSPCESGGARATARYFQSPAAGGSAHKVVDPSEVVICASDDVICWHAPPNRHSLGIELTDPMNRRAARWTDGGHVAMLHLAATEMRGWCHKYNIPITRIEVPGLLHGLHGLCGHVDVSNAWHESNHWDPGPYFPWATFIGLTANIIDQEDAMSADTEKLLQENFFRLMEQQKRQHATDRASVSAFVPLWYTTYLGRPASRGAVTTWLKKFDSGYEIDEIEQAIRNSPEARNHDKG